MPRSASSPVAIVQSASAAVYRVFAGICPGVSRVTPGTRHRERHARLTCDLSLSTKLTRLFQVNARRVGSLPF